MDWKALLKQTEAWIEVHREEFISELQGMTRIPSISRKDLATPGAPFGPDCRRVLDYALERGSYYGFETMNHEGYAGSIYMGNPEDSLGLFCHLDVVPVGDGWIYPPFEAVYLPEYDAVIGRGADDNKCAAVACLFAMRMLREFRWPLKHGVRLYCGTSEETGMQDMIALQEKGMQFPKLSLVPDSGFPVNFGQKGAVNGEISMECSGNLLSFHAGTTHNVVPEHAECTIAVDETQVRMALCELDSALTINITTEPHENGTRIIANGKSSHTASPQNGVNAIWLLTKALAETNLLKGNCVATIQQLCRFTADYTGQTEGVAYSDDMSGNLSIVYSMAHTKNGRLYVTIDSRTPITCDVEELTEHLKNVWSENGFAIESTSYSKPYYVPVDDAGVVALQEVFQYATGSDHKPFVMGGGNYARVIPNAYSFGPGFDTKIKISDFLPEGHGNCHSKDEAVVMDKVHNCAKIYALAIARLDTMFD